jgi:hypothetical protein
VGLRIAFSWQDDRYGHEIAYVDQLTASTLLVTQRESDRLPWPASPPLQQISWLETVPGQRVALLVGMAGKSHWSFSVEADRGSVGLVMDVACRVPSQPEWLGSTYQCQYEVSGQTPGAACFDVGDRVCTVMAESPSGSQSVAISSSGTRLSIAPRLDRINTPVTVRWKYRVALGAAQPSKQNDLAGW